MHNKEIIASALSELKNKLESNDGLAIFAAERAKFEGWLKVELCSIFCKYFDNVMPEKGRVDISIDGSLIELKTVNTNIRYANVKNKTRPITKNIQGVIDDIKKLRKINSEHRSILFVAFPIEHNNKYWQLHLDKIKEFLHDITAVEFEFKNRIPGVIYYGDID